MRRQTRRRHRSKAPGPKEPAPSDRREKIVVTVATGTAPDIYSEASNVMGTFVINGVAAPIDRYLRASPDAGDIHPSILRDLTFGGKTYGLPINVYPVMDLYHLRMLEEAGIAEPSVWDELIAAASRLTRLASDGSLQVTGYQRGDSKRLASISLGYHMEQLGRSIIGPVDHEVSLDNEIGRRALNFMVDLWRTPIIPDGGPNEVEAFLAGRVAIQHDQSGRTLAVAGALDPPFQMGIRRFVEPSAETDIVAYNAFNLVLVSSSPNPDAAWRVMEAFAGPERLKEYLLAYGGIQPPRFSLMSDPDLSSQPFWNDLVGVLSPPIHTSGPMNPAFTAVRDTIGDYVLRAIHEGMGVATALQEAERISNAIIRDQAGR